MVVQSNVNTLVFGLCAGYMPPCVKNIFKNINFDRSFMQEFADQHTLRTEIRNLMIQNNLADDCFLQMLDYVIDLFETNGLGMQYYGYHDINHELEVSYITLLAATSDTENNFSRDDIRHLFVAALFHDFDPTKSVDKPHEQNVVKIISTDKTLQHLLDDSKADLEIIKALILRTTYPWSGSAKDEAMSLIQDYFRNSNLARDNKQFQEHVMYMGRYLSVIDRIGGYALGDFSKAMEMAKMNSHAMAWKPSRIVKNSVIYFENLLDTEAELCKMILAILPKHMRKNFFNTVLSFMNIRQQEITIQANFAYDNLKLVPTIDNMSTRLDPEFSKALYAIFLELPKPLQFGGDTFEESIKSSDTILTTLRQNTPDGEIIGFAKGGPLERYNLRREIQDKNYGLKNTVFLEPLALKLGYYGLKGGSEMRHMFIMQAIAKKFKNMTSFALRDVIEARINKENAEFVAQFDPERWDYYRINLESFK